MKTGNKITSKERFDLMNILIQLNSDLNESIINLILKSCVHTPQTSENMWKSIQLQLQQYFTRELIDSYIQKEEGKDFAEYLFMSKTKNIFFGYHYFPTD